MRLAAIIAIALISGCFRTPMQPDRPELGAFAPGPRNGPAVDVTQLVMARSKQPACGLVWDASCLSRVEMVHAAYLVKHPKATFLVDAGLSSKADADLAKFSFSTRQAFSFDLQQGLGAALAAVHAPPIDFVILTHPHWDHTSGLVDLPKPRVKLSVADSAFLDAPHEGEPVVMPEHLADAIRETYAFDGPPYENFPASHDLFGDGAVILVPLPGHTPGATGVFLTDQRGRRLFFVGDTVWSSEGLRLLAQRPSFLSGKADADPALVSDSIRRIRHLQEKDPSLVVVPAHDGAAFEAAPR